MVPVQLVPLRKVGSYQVVAVWLLGKLEGLNAGSPLRKAVLMSGCKLGLVIVESASL